MHSTVCALLRCQTVSLSVPERSDVPVEVIEYEEFSQQMTYKLTPSEEEGTNWFTLNVGTVGKHKVRLVLFMRDEMAFESGKVAESNPMLLKVREDREKFLEQVRELFPKMRIGLLSPSSISPSSITST